MTFIENPPSDLYREYSFENLFDEILGRVSSYIYEAGVKPQTETYEKDVHTIVFDFDTWQTEYRCFKPEAKTDKIFETVIRRQDSMSWIPLYEITLTLFNDGGRNIKLKDLNGNKTSFSSKNIRENDELTRQIENESTLIIFSAFPSLGLSDIYVKFTGK